MVTKERKFKKRPSPRQSKYQFQEPVRPEDDKSSIGNSRKRADEQPKGLDELVPHTPDKVDLISELAGL